MSFHLLAKGWFCLWGEKNWFGIFGVGEGGVGSGGGDEDL
jgi:hypothetical protein